MNSRNGSHQNRLTPSRSRPKRMSWFSRERESLMHHSANQPSVATCAGDGTCSDHRLRSHKTSNHFRTLRSNEHRTFGHTRSTGLANDMKPSMDGKAGALIIGTGNILTRFLSFSLSRTKQIVLAIATDSAS